MIVNNNIIKEFVNHVFAFFIIVGIVGLLSFSCWLYKQCSKPPVKESVSNTVNIDSITTVNDSIKLQVKSLDSIKNAKVIEIISLDNDSSIKLFYELVSR